MAQAGVDDHEALMRLATVPSRAQLPGRWRMDIVHARQSTGVAYLTFAPGPRGRIESRVEVTDAGRGALPPVVVGHFTSADFAAAGREARRLDDDLLVGKWVTDFSGPYAKLLLAGAVRLFRPVRTPRGKRRFALHYLLSRA